MNKTNQKEVFEWLMRIERLNFKEKGTPHVYPKASMLALVFGISRTRAYSYLEMFNKYLIKRK